MNILRWLVLIIVLPIALYLYNSPTYQHRYKLTVEIEVAGKTQVAESILTVTRYVPAIILDAPQRAFDRVDGESPMFDLGDRGVLLAAILPSSDDFERDPNNANRGPALTAVQFAYVAIKSSKPKETRELAEREDLRYAQAIQKFSGKYNLKPQDYPAFIWLRSRDNPSTARPLLASQIPNVIGPDVRVTRATVEMTTDKPLHKLREQLPWLEALHQKEHEHGYIKHFDKEYTFTTKEILGGPG